MNRINVLIADDHAIVRTGLAALLDAEDDIAVVGEAENGETAVKLAQKLKPDVVIMDLMMPVMDGIAATDRLKAVVPETKVLILTTSTVSDDIARTLDAGADGVITKSTANDNLLAAIRDVVRGRRPVSREYQDLLLQDPPLPNFTDRQLEILSSITRGLTNPDIAKQYGISPESVKDHINLIFAKLGAANRTEAVAIALRKHLLKI